MMHNGNWATKRNKTNGKGWAVGYEPADIGYRAKQFRHFDFRHFLRDLRRKLGR
jgi:hypothetical protein